MAKSTLRKWTIGLFGATINSIATAVTAGIGLPAIDKTGQFDMLSLNWFEMVGALMFVSGFLGFFGYLKGHPIEEVFIETETTTTATQSGDTMKIQQTVTEKKVENPQ